MATKISIEVEIPDMTCYKCGGVTTCIPTHIERVVKVDGDDKFERFEVRSFAEPEGWRWIHNITHSKRMAAKPHAYCPACIKGIRVAMGELDETP